MPAATRKPATRKPAAKKPAAQGLGPTLTAWLAQAPRVDHQRLWLTVRLFRTAKTKVSLVLSDAGVSAKLNWTLDNRKYESRWVRIGPGIVSCATTDKPRRCGTLDDTLCPHVLAASLAAELAGVDPAQLTSWLAAGPTKAKSDRDACIEVGKQKGAAQPLAAATVDKLLHPQLATVDLALDPHVGEVVGLFAIAGWVDGYKTQHAIDCIADDERHGHPVKADAELKKNQLLGAVVCENLHSLSIRSNGQYQCFNRQGRPCVGMYSDKPCVHIAAAVVRLFAQNKLSWAWFAKAKKNARREKDPKLGKVLTEWLFHFTEAEAFDWRPNETMAEDVYASS